MIETWNFFDLVFETKFAVTEDARNCISSLWFLWICVLTCIGNAFYKTEFFRVNLIHQSQSGRATLTGLAVVVSELKHTCAVCNGQDRFLVPVLAYSAYSPVVCVLSERDLQCLGKSWAIHLHFTNSSGSTTQAEQIQCIMKTVVPPGNYTTCFPFPCIKKNTELCLYSQTWSCSS